METVTVHTGMFLTGAAEKRVEEILGMGLRTCPFNNYWQLVSTERLKITTDDIPGLMLFFGVDMLTDYKRYFRAMPQEQKDETP